MPIQFLLNADGSIPDGVDADVLISLGIPLILPTEQPDALPGCILVEAEPKDGVQVWVQKVQPAEIMVPEPAPVEAPEIALLLKSMSEEQKRLLVTILGG